MTRVLLVALALLVSLLVLARLLRPASPAGVSVAVAAPVRPSSAAARNAPPPPPPPPAPDSGTTPPASIPSRTPAIDILARAAAKSRLAAAGPYVYFDSMFVDTDSSIRHWPDPQGIPLSVAVVSAEPDAALDAAVRGAIGAWEDVGPGFRFSLIADTTAAQIVIHTKPKPVGDQVGETVLQWTPAGGIRSATITAYRYGPDGKVLAAPVLLAVMTHEFGHALGLGHSPDQGDVMFAAARVVRPSQRDRATLTLLYELPLGHLREATSR